MTKAETLAFLKPLLQNARIEDLYVFNVQEYQEYKDKVIKKIRDTFDNTIVIRSSALNEDARTHSNAGYYTSILHINPQSALHVSDAVERIIADYQSKEHFSPLHQILVQNQTDSIQTSGVIFTQNPRNNTPYYVINFDESEVSDSVTSGIAHQKVLILRDIGLEQVPKKWQPLIRAVKEVEQILSSTTLDIEFAIDKQSRVTIFQARPLIIKEQQLEESTFTATLHDVQMSYQKRIAEINTTLPIYLSDMAFWNPSEIIGSKPHPLDYSLYAHLILQSNWNEALVPLGYTPVHDRLMEQIGSKPYINLYYSFLTLLPQSLPQSLKDKLIHFYNKKIKEYPYLHDKIEFHVTYNCYTFGTDRDLQQLTTEGFTGREINTINYALRDLTNRVLLQYKRIIEDDVASIRRLEIRRNLLLQRLHTIKQTDIFALLEVACQLLEDCRRFGTSQFTRVARMAFIGNALIKSLQTIEGIDYSHYQTFLSTISTVATEFYESSRSAEGIESMKKKYGHLRAGTYDITQLPYEILFTDQDFVSMRDSSPKEIATFSSAQGEALTKELGTLCKEKGLTIEQADLLDFVRLSIQNREFFKFEFTKNLSEALEIIVTVGEQLGFSREDLSFLIVDDVIFSSKDKSVLQKRWEKVIVERKKRQLLYDSISLPPIIFTERDIAVVTSLQAVPNFITKKAITAKVVYLNGGEKDKDIDLKGKIVLVEKADPGYDWIFAHDIAGLVTQYGGVASHMAIRCTEFELPAAIGCGETLFNQVIESKKITIDGKRQKLGFF